MVLGDVEGVLNYSRPPNKHYLASSCFLSLFLEGLETTGSNIFSFHVAIWRRYVLSFIAFVFLMGYARGRLYIRLAFFLFQADIPKHTQKNTIWQLALPKNIQSHQSICLRYPQLSCKHIWRVPTPKNEVLSSATRP